MKVALPGVRGSFAWNRNFMNVCGAPAGSSDCLGYQYVLRKGTLIQVVNAPEMLLHPFIRIDGVKVAFTSISKDNHTGGIGLKGMLNLFHSHNDCT